MRFGPERTFVLAATIGNEPVPGLTRDLERPGTPVGRGPGSRPGRGLPWVVGARAQPPPRASQTAPGPDVARLAAAYSTWIA